MKKTVVKKKKAIPTLKTKGTTEKPKGHGNVLKKSKCQKRGESGEFLSPRVHSGVFKRVDSHFKNFDLRRAFLETFYMLGGVEELAKWAAYSNQNQTEFYKMLAKMLPREVGISGGDIEPNKLSGLEDRELDAIINRHLQRS